MKKVNIPEKMQKFYGVGTMLHPDEAMVESLIKEIPAGQVSTIDSLCDRLSKDHGTNVTCPMRTTHFVKTITANYLGRNKSIPFWRVIRKNHLLINSPFTELCAVNLEKEGLQITQNRRGAFKVENVAEVLFSFS